MRGIIFSLAIAIIVSPFLVSHDVFAATDIEQRRAELERELEQLEKEIQEQSKLLVDKRAERVSVERDVAILNAEIKKAQLSIRAREIEIARLGTQIGNKEETIQELDQKLGREKDSLAQIIRRTNQIDDYTLVEVVLSNKQLSDFFEDLDDFSMIKQDLQVSFQEIANTQDDTEAEKTSLENKQDAERELRNLQQLEKEKIEEAEAQKQQILAIKKSEESAYQSILAAKEKTASEIRAALFSLRDSADISFGQAYDYAKAAGAAVGVRPAFILGILKNESDLGKNVGQCLLTDPATGTGKGVNTGRVFQKVMKPGRDVEPYLQITKELGIDPFSQVVSCPQSIGYGGAMGPAQFIASTWVLYKDRLGQITGQNPPNPWDPRTAFFASAMLLADNGANKGTYASERLAALRYFAGWSNAENPAFASYGDRVMGFATEFQRQIDILEGN